MVNWGDSLSRFLTYQSQTSIEVCQFAINDLAVERRRWDLVYHGTWNSVNVREH
jgi:hypothetical protein